MKRVRPGAWTHKIKVVGIGTNEFRNKREWLINSKFRTVDRGDHVERETSRIRFAKINREGFFSSTIESSVRISPPGKISSIELEILSHG